MSMCRIRSLGSFPHLAVLLTYFLFLNGLVSICQAQNEPDTGETPASTLQGHCNPESLPDPCTIGDKYGDPGNCTVYYECSTASNKFELHTCDSGSKYDYKKKKCRVERPDLKKRIRCTPPCDAENNKNNKRKQEVENEEPEVDPQTETPTEEIKQNVTSNEMESITESNEPLATEGDDTGVNVGGNLSPDNDTINTAMVDPNVPNLPADATNTTTGETVEETEAQTEKDVITTASSSHSTASTVPSTTKPTTKPTTKSTTTTQPGVIVVETDGDPGYDIVTSPPGNSSGSVGNVDESKKVSSATIGIAVGIIVALLIVSVAVVLLICRIRKKKTSKEKKIVSIENPKYKKSGGDKHAYRFSRDASLLVNENFFQEKPANNNSTEKLAFIPGRKRPAPSTPSKDKNKEKRKAPPPPNPFTGEVDNDENYRPPTFRKDSSDLYERDTDGSTEGIELSTFSAPTSSFGTGTGTFGKPRTLVDPRKKETPNGQLQQSRSTDYSSDEDDSDEDDKLLGRKYQSEDTDDAVFKDDVTAKDVNNSMDAYLSAYDQALK